MADLKLVYDYTNDEGKRELIYEDERGNRYVSKIAVIDGTDARYLEVDNKKRFVSYAKSAEKNVLVHDGEDALLAIQK